MVVHTSGVVPGTRLRTLSPWDSGPLLIAVAAFVFSAQSLAIKLLGGRVPIFQVVLYPALFCWLLTTAVVKAYKLSLASPSWRIAGLTLARSLLGTASITCFYLSVVRLPLKEAVTLFFTSPVIAAVLEWALLRESHGWGGTAGAVFTVAGVIFISQPDWLFRYAGGYQAVPAPSQGGGQKTAGVILATSAALANGSAFLVVRVLKQTVQAAVLTWYYHLVVAAVSLSLLLLTHPGGPVRPSTGDVGLLVAIAATQFCGQLLLNRGFQLVTATRGAAINVLQVFFSFGWGLAVLHEPLSLLSLLGSACVAAGVVCVALTGSGVASKGSEAAEPGGPGAASQQHGGPGTGHMHDAEAATAAAPPSSSYFDDGSAGDLRQPLLLAVAGRLSLDSAT